MLLKFSLRKLALTASLVSKFAPGAVELGCSRAPSQGGAPCWGVGSGAESLSWPQAAGKHAELLTAAGDRPCLLLSRTPPTMAPGTPVPRQHAVTLHPSSMPTTLSHREASAVDQTALLPEGLQHTHSTHSLPAGATWPPGHLHSDLAGSLASAVSAQFFHDRSPGPRHRPHETRLCPTAQRPPAASVQVGKLGPHPVSHSNKARHQGNCLAQAQLGEVGATLRPRAHGQTVRVEQLCAMQDQPGRALSRSRWLSSNRAAWASPAAAPAVSVHLLPAGSVPNPVVTGSPLCIHRLPAEAGDRCPGWAQGSASASACPGLLS